MMTETHSTLTKNIAPVLSFTVLVLVWEATVRLSGWDTNVLPGPYKVLESMTELIANGSIFKHTVASLFRVTLGFYIAAILGIPLGIILGRSQIASILFSPVISFLRPISPLAWIPLAMLWFGIGDKPAIFLIFLASFFPIVMATTVAVHSINPTYFYVAANFNFSRTEVIQKVVIPAIIPDVITALRLSVAIAWVVVVAAEMIAVQSGLGYLILDSRNGLRMDYVMDGMIVIGLIGLFLDYIMRRLSRIESASWGVKQA
ncbi:ABC transporter permease [Candidatus Electrothrix sp.]|uniref:ABC transporter permease n=1 Tax=Candidatus Electrothrix sp. TaxID=2170559 RepID=UPI0040579B8A